MSKFCILLYLGTHREYINTSPDQIRQNLRMTLTYIFNFRLYHQGQRSNIKTDLPMHIYGIRQCRTPNIKLLLFIVPDISSGQKNCSEGHWVKVKGEICKITSLCITKCHDDVTHQIWDLYHWQLLSNGTDKICQKHRVQGHHTKVKCQR